jgi:hypothetical protein
MANPITECDRVRSYAAPDPPICMATSGYVTFADAAPIWTFCVSQAM